MTFSCINIKYLFNILSYFTTLFCLQSNPGHRCFQVYIPLAHLLMTIFDLLISVLERILFINKKKVQQNAYHNKQERHTTMPKVKVYRSDLPEFVSRVC